MPIPTILLLLVVLTLTDGLGEELGWRGYALPSMLSRGNAVMVNSQLVISSSRLGTQWPTVLEQLTNPEASFDPLVIAVSGSVNRFVRDLESGG